MIQDYSSDVLIATEEEILAFRAGVQAATDRNGGRMMPVPSSETDVAEWIQNIQEMDAKHAAHIREFEETIKAENAEHAERWEREGSRRL